jgi:hypothetical protein
MTVLDLELAGYVEPESDNDEHYNDKLLRTYDAIAEQIRRKINDGSFYQHGLLLSLFIEEHQPH